MIQHFIFSQDYAAIVVAKYIFQKFLNFWSILLSKNLLSLLFSLKNEILNLFFQIALKVFQIFSSSTNIKDLILLRKLTNYTTCQRTIDTWKYFIILINIQKPKVKTSNINYLKQEIEQSIFDHNIKLQHCLLW